MSEVPDALAVESYLRGLQDRLCEAIQAFEPSRPFVSDRWSKPPESPLRGDGDTRILEGGDVFERGGIAFSHVRGDRLPPSATVHRPELAGRSFRALGVSLVMHPRNPFGPTAHMNVRFLAAEAEQRPPAWWFGGGFDLTPYYGFDEDVRHWHDTARSACAPFTDSQGAPVYPAFAKACNDYFFLRHRGESRGIGGLFFDDWTQGGFSASFALLRSVGDHFLPAYLPIVQRRSSMDYGERERAWQLYRRGRYVEFNLVWDRGTHFGLQSGGRTESILMSMPPLATWRYGHEPEPGSPEAELYERFLVRRPV